MTALLLTQSPQTLKKWDMVESVKYIPRKSGRPVGSKSRIQGKARKSGGGRPKMAPAQKIENIIERQFDGKFANYESVKKCVSARQAAKKIGFKLSSYYTLNKLFKDNPEILTGYQSQTAGPETVLKSKPSNESLV